MSSQVSSISVDFSVNKRGQAQGKFKPRTKPRTKSKPKDKWVISEFTSPAGKSYIKRVNQSTGVVEVQRVHYY